MKFLEGERPEGKNKQEWQDEFHELMIDQSWKIARISVNILWVLKGRQNVISRRYESTDPV